MKLNKEMLKTRNFLVNLDGKMFLINDMFNVQSTHDEYYAVGKITEVAQDWEILYKQYVKLFWSDKKKVDSMPLNKLIEACAAAEKIDKERCQALKKIASARNYINHYFFKDDFSSTYDDYGRITDFAPRNKILNNAFSLICEAIDLTQKYFNSLNLEYDCAINVQTIFDKKQ